MNWGVPLLSWFFSWERGVPAGSGRACAAPEEVPPLHFGDTVPGGEQLARFLPQVWWAAWSSRARLIRGARSSSSSRTSFGLRTLPSRSSWQEMALWQGDVGAPRISLLKQGWKSSSKCEPPHTGCLGFSPAVERPPLFRTGWHLWCLELPTGCSETLWLVEDYLFIAVLMYWNDWERQSASPYRTEGASSLE